MNTTTPSNHTKSSPPQKARIEVNPKYQPYLWDKNRYMVLYGGAGSGKSFFSSQKAIFRLTTEHNHRFLGTRKVKDTIRGSIYQDLIDTIDNFGIRPEFYINKNEFRITHIPTGNEIVLVGLDDPIKLKSITGITSIMCEEADQMTEEDFDQLDIRLRGETENYKQITMTFNPVDENHWLKRRFFDQEQPRASFLHTTYKDNTEIDEEYKEILESKGKVNENFYRVYVLGQWGKAEIDKPYMYNFAREKHVGKVIFDPNKQVILSFDFNIEPFVVLAGQVYRDHIHHIRLFKEFVSDSGDIDEKINDIKTYFKTHYGEEIANRVITSCIITGDATGSQRRVGMKKNEDAWRQVCSSLSINPRSGRFKVPKSNPDVSDNRFLCNALLARHPDIQFDEGMTHTINEMVHTEADEEGKIKKKDRNKEAQRADGLDCFRYLCNAMARDFNAKPKKYGAV